MGNNAVITELEAVEKDLAEKLQSVRNTLGMLRNMYNSNNGQSAQENAIAEKYDDYNKTWTFRDKFSYVLKRENRFLHVREIAAIVHTLEPKLSVKQILDKLSPTITFFKKEKAIVKVVVGNHFNTFWGSKNWVDNDGKPKEAHMYDLNQVDFKRKKENINI